MEKRLRRKIKSHEGNRAVRDREGYEVRRARGLRRYKMRIFLCYYNFITRHLTGKSAIKWWTVRLTLSTPLQSVREGLQDLERSIFALAISSAV
jgi:hypothetical protein